MKSSSHILRILDFPQLNAIWLNVNIIRKPIWNNDCNLKIEGKSMFNENWIKSGVLYVKDSLDGELNIQDLRSTAKVLKNKSNWLHLYEALSIEKKILLLQNLLILTWNRNFVFTLDMVNSLGKRELFFYQNSKQKKFI